MKYYVRMVRPRFEVKFIEIDAENESQAQSTATTIGMESKTGWKPIKRATEDYFPHIERCLTANDFAANEMTVEEGREELSSVEVPEQDKYLLLYADTFSGEGELVPQAWLLRQRSLMISDLCSDWIIDLQSMAESALDGFEEGIKPEAMETAKILLFKLKRDNEDGDNDPPTGAA